MYKDNDHKRIYWCIKNKVGHMSPTISPAPKNIERNEIESIYEALKFYKENGIETVVVQKKYMGSYCDIELHKDITESRLFSRNAYLINHIDKEQVFNALKPIHNRFKWDDIDKVLIQAELMPWAAMGKKLIDREFRSYSFLYENHLNYLEESGLQEKLQNLKTKQFLEFIEDSENLSEKEIREKYKNHERANFRTIRDFKYLPIPEMKEGLELHNKQIDIFGAEGEVYFKPFNVLKSFFNDGTEEVNDSNILGFQKVSNDGFLVLDTNDFEECVKLAYGFFDEFVSEGGEGIVIKPEQVFVKDIPHCFKVRGNAYLHLIYGINFNVDYDHYLQKRNTCKKMKMQIQQWEIAQNMLLLKESEINDKNDRYLELLTKRFQSERRAVEIDSRL